MGGVAGNKNWGAPATYWQRELGVRRKGSRRIPKWYDGPFDTGDDAHLRTAVEAAATVAAALDPYLHGKAIEPVARQCDLSTKTVGEIVAGKVWPGLETSRSSPMPSVCGCRSSMPQRRPAGAAATRRPGSPRPGHSSRRASWPLRISPVS